MSRWWREVTMQLANLLRETLNVDCDEVWENERTPTPVRVFGVRQHSMGLSVREVVAVLELLGIDRSHGAIWNWTHKLSEAQRDPPTAQPSRVAVDEKQIEARAVRLSEGMWRAIWPNAQTGRTTLSKAISDRDELPDVSLSTTDNDDTGSSDQYARILG